VSLVIWSYANVVSIYCISPILPYKSNWLFGHSRALKTPMSGKLHQQQNDVALHDFKY